MHSEHRRHSGWRDTDRLDSFDCTIANLSELVCDVLDAAGSSSVAEVGAEHGLFTERLLAWGTGAEDRRGERGRSLPAPATGRARRRPPRARAGPAHQPRRPARARSPRRGDPRRRPQLLHGQRGAAADRRAGRRLGAAAAALPRHRLAARPPRQLPRHRADPRPASPAGGPRRLSDPGRTRDRRARALLRVHGDRGGRPAKRRPDRGRGLPRHALGPAPRGGRPVLRSRCDLARRGLIRPGARGDARPLGVEPDARAGRAQADRAPGGGVREPAADRRDLHRRTTSTATG